MNILVESLKRIYKTGKPIKLSKEGIRQRVIDGKISESDYEYITGEKYDE